MAADQNISLATALEHVNIAKLKQQQIGFGSDIEALALIQREIEAREKLVELVSRKDQRAAAAKDAQKALSDFDQLMGNIDLSKLNGMFDGAADGALRFVTALNTVAEVNSKMQAALEANNITNANNAQKRAKEEERILSRSETATVSAYGTMAGALKGYAKEGSRTYKALENAEKVFRAFELASAISNMATKSGLYAAFVGAKVAGDATMTASGTAAAAADISTTVAVGQAKAITGVANQAQGDPYTAFPRMAAMAAIMAALGFAVGGFGGGGGGAAPTNEGTGTVFGDSSAKSESLTKSLDLLNNTQDIALTYSKSMAASLRAIEGNIGGLTNIYLRTGGTTGLTDTIATGKFDSALSSVLKNPLFTSTGVASALIPAFGSLVTSLFGGSTSITGSGISANKQTLAQIQSQGFQGNYYADVQTKKKAFGVTYSSSNSTQLARLDATLEQQITAVFKNIGAAVGTAADFLGEDTAAINKRLQGYIVDIGRVNLAGLTGTQITEKLQNIFGAEADKLAASIVPGFEKMQKVGEGYFETLSRMANQFELVNVYIRRTGDTLGSVGVNGAKAADSLIGLFGGLDAFQTSVQDFYEGFYSEAERTAQSSKEVAAALAGIGQPMPATIEAFRDLVKAQNLTTTAGQEAYAALIQISPAFKQIADSAKEAMQAFEEAFYSPSELKASQFSSIKKAFDEIGLQVQDGVKKGRSYSEWFEISKGNDVSIEKEVPNLINQSLPTTLEGYRKLVDAQDQATDAGKRARAMLIELGPQFADFIKEQEVAQAAIASQRQGLQDQLDGLLGNTAALRERERSSLDVSNRALYDQIQALRDQKEAAEKAAQAENQRIEAMKSATNSLIQEIRRLRGLDQAYGGAGSLQAQFAILTAQAKAGDSSALSRLPEITKAIEDAALTSAKTSRELAYTRAMLAVSLADTVTSLGGTVPAFAAGGLHSGGLRLVGENGPELEITGPARYYSAAETSSMMGGGMVDELRGLREEVAMLRAEARATAINTGRTQDIMKRITKNGESMIVSTDGEALEVTAP
jgi:hypothetical protein